ncbi:hypothetical protein STSP2_00518 [Anaerohalosphaera lusitana]|uniref:Uncharacterized protein n=1 Tax=Anaerohalosphaera lusitana TaxID=1936003 RepID=A0A1U9NI21_9BACT|nr:DUF4175 domain-containing protein [Anaerohalosphaera lusitana]AQT67374.1 hypothetical protein STSP2_00518 [Anaerohalosphaera lusitana]
MFGAFRGYRSVFVIVMLAIFAGGLFAAPNDRGQRRGPGQMPGMLPPGMGGPGEMGPGGHGMRGHGQGGYSGALGQVLKEVLQTVNAGGELSKEKQLEVRQTLQQEREQRRSVEYQLLEAWSNYFAGDMKGAYRGALMANKADPESADAQRTLVATAVMSGSKQYMQNAMKQVGGEIGDGGMLDLDLAGLNAAMIGQKVGPIQAVCMNSTQFMYPGKGNLCMMVWQLEEKVQVQPGGMGQVAGGEPNSMGGSDDDDRGGSRRNQNGRRGYGGGHGTPGMMPPGMGSNGHGYGGGYGGRGQMTNFDEQMMEFRNLFVRYAGNGDVAFVGVNTDSAVNSGKVAAELVSKAWPWAQVMAERGGLGEYAQMSVDPDKPMMVLTDKRGVVTYAGPASGFLPKSMMTSMEVQPVAFGSGTGGAGQIDAAVAQQMQAVSQMSEEEQQGLLGRMMGAMGGEGQQGQAAGREQSREQQRGSQMQNEQRGGQQQQAQQQAGQAGELSVAQEYDAGKLLRQAQVQLGGTSPGSILRMSRKRSERGIKYCREILQKYPRTKYADEARNLLRKVPDRYKDAFNVTDEEMGL